METYVIRALAVLALMSASALPAAAPAANPSATLKSTLPWWEKVTVTVASDGKPQSCKYETSLRPDDSKSCEVVGDAGNAAAMTAGAGATAKDQYTRLTFERRFHPGASAPGGRRRRSPATRCLGGK